MQHPADPEPGAGSGADQDPPDDILQDLVLELERHSAEQGWDQPIRLYALVPTADLVEREPHVAELLGIQGPVPPDALTPVEQDPLPTDQSLEDVLGRLAWPEAVTGCAMVMERLVVRGSDATLDPLDTETPADPSSENCEEVRMVAGVLRDGSTHSALRMRSHDSADSVLNGRELIPGLTSALALTLEAD
ncbi:PPA1309 family protein [Lipingzhangella sp. LS1_29]|uniref:PPA1309 family protein n=1 Tax=Lipingzhangella rawalii TaxID=2055835 RepID=A0ABU2HB44_9ACTN|nr:PPA1309 family protein [Lipingzhangella rawalii]MDS1272546.1 PPA1309 family protein [Lipingzhangella rawalii]